MARREMFTVGEIISVGSSKGAVTVIMRDASNNVLMCKCATGDIPSRVAGYAVGCILIDTTSGACYSNTDSTTTCTFTAFV